MKKTDKVELNWLNMVSVVARVLGGDLAAAKVVVEKYVSNGPSLVRVLRILCGENLSSIRVNDPSTGGHDTRARKPYELEEINLIRQAAGLPGQYRNFGRECHLVLP